MNDLSSADNRSPSLYLHKQFQLRKLDKSGAPQNRRQNIECKIKSMDLEEKESQSLTKDHSMP